MPFSSAITFQRTNTLRIELSNLTSKINLESLHDAIRRDSYLKLDEILSFEPDYYYKACFVKATTKQVAERA